MRMDWGAPSSKTRKLSCFSPAAKPPFLFRTVGWSITRSTSAEKVGLPDWAVNSASANSRHIIIRVPKTRRVRPSRPPTAFVRSGRSGRKSSRRRDARQRASVHKGCAREHPRRHPVLILLTRAREPQETGAAQTDEPEQPDEGNRARRLRQSPGQPRTGGLSGSGRGGRRLRRKDFRDLYFFLSRLFGLERRLLHRHDFR